MSELNDDIRITVIDSHHFVLDTLREAGRGDLFPNVEDDDLADEVFIAINELVQILGGHIEGSAENVEHAANLRALIGRRYHINIKKTAWKALLGSVPIAVMLIRGMAHDTTAFIQAGGAVLSVLEIFRDNLQKLLPDEVTVYLAVKALTKETKTPCQTQAIAGYLTAQTKDEVKWTDEAVQQLLTNMVSKKILKQEVRGYRIVV